MSVQMVLFLAGTLVVAITPFLLGAYLLNVPAVMRHERDPQTLVRLLMLAFSAFCVGGGLVLVSPLDPALAPFGVASVALGLLIAARVWFAKARS